MTSTHDLTINENESRSMKQILFASIATWLVEGKLDKLYLEGTDSQIDALKDAMLASKDFQDELYKPQATLQSLSEKLEIKSRAAKIFEKELGMPWLL